MPIKQKTLKVPWVPIVLQPMSKAPDTAEVERLQTKDPGALLHAPEIPMKQKNVMIPWAEAPSTAPRPVSMALDTVEMDLDENVVEPMNVNEIYLERFAEQWPNVRKQEETLTALING